MNCQDLDGAIGYGVRSGILTHLESETSQVVEACPCPSLLMIS
jgi:hypothetical protein